MKQTTFLTKTFSLRCPHRASNTPSTNNTKSILLWSTLACVTTKPPTSVQESSNVIALIMKQQCPQTAPALQPLHRDHNCPLHHHIGFLILYFYANCCLFTDWCADLPALIIYNESRHREVDVEGWSIYALVCIFHYDELASLSKFQVSGSWIWWCSDGTPMEGRKKSFKKTAPLALVMKWLAVMLS